MITPSFVLFVLFYFCERESCYTVQTIFELTMLGNLKLTVILLSAGVTGMNHQPSYKICISRFREFRNPVIHIKPKKTTLYLRDMCGVGRGYMRMI